MPFCKTAAPSPSSQLEAKKTLQLYFGYAASRDPLRAARGWWAVAEDRPPLNSRGGVRVDVPAQRP
jgi:hypothetical protein